MSQKPVLEQELARRQDRERARMGRDAYSFWHFPLVSGIIALAVGFEGAFHPTDDGASQITAAIGIGLALFLIATAGAATPTQTLSIGCAGLVTIIVVEQATVRRRLARL